MWRAFFLAIGIMLIILGVECTVVGRFQISQDANLPLAVEKMLAGEGWGGDLSSGNLANSEGNIGMMPSRYAANVAPPQPIQGYGGMPTVSSQYGPSRFSSGQFGNDQFSSFGSNSNKPSQTANSQFSLAGFGSRPASDSNTSLTLNRGGTSRLVQTKDWMPWSLIAAGTIIVLYTKSIGRNDFGSAG